MAKRRTKRDLYLEPTDPKFPQQWYLVRCWLSLWAPLSFFLFCLPSSLSLPSLLSLGVSSQSSFFSFF